MSGRSVLTDRDAVAIANKLNATVSEGRKHQRASVRLNGQHVGSFGIRRGGGGHDYIPGQIHATKREAIDLARCPLSRDEFTQRLIQRGVLLGQNS